MGDRLDVREFGFADSVAFKAVISADGPGGQDARIALDLDRAVVLHDVSPDILDARPVVLM